MNDVAKPVLKVGQTWGADSNANRYRLLARLDDAHGWLVAVRKPNGEETTLELRDGIFGSRMYLVSEPVKKQPRKGQIWGNTRYPDRRYVLRSPIEGGWSIDVYDSNWMYQHGGMLPHETWGEDAFFLMFEMTMPVPTPTSAPGPILMPGQRWRSKHTRNLFELVREKTSMTAPTMWKAIVLEHFQGSPAKTVHFFLADFHEDLMVMEGWADPADQCGVGGCRQAVVIYCPHCDRSYCYSHGGVGQHPHLQFECKGGCKRLVINTSGMCTECENGTKVSSERPPVSSSARPRSVLPPAPRCGLGPGCTVHRPVMVKPFVPDVDDDHWIPDAPTVLGRRRT